MGLDDAADYCETHQWRVVAVVLAVGEGSTIEYECAVCSAVITRGTGEPFPD